MVVSVQITSVTIRIRPSLLFPHFAKDRFISGIQVEPTRSETFTQSITSHTFSKTVCHHATCVYPSHHVGLIWSDIFSYLYIGSEPDHLSQRSQIDAESLVAAFRKRCITKMIVERIAIDHPYVTHETGSVVFPICTQEHSMCISQGSTESHGFFDSVWDSICFRLQSGSTHSTYDRRGITNQMHPHTFFLKRIWSSEKSHPPFLTAEIWLVSEASIGNGEHLHIVPGEKSAFEEQSFVRWFFGFLQQFVGKFQIIKRRSPTHGL